KDKEGSIKEDLVAKDEMQIDQLEDEGECVKKAQATVWPEFYEQVGGKDKINELLILLDRESI
ncbi:hypothetical protein V6255_18240, partial [Psychromonas arctica]